MENIDWTTLCFVVRAELTKTSKAEAQTKT